MFTKPLSLAADLVVAGRAYQPSKMEQRAYALLTALALSNNSAFAAGGGAAGAALSSVGQTVVSIVQVLFTIGLIIYLLVVVFKLMSKSPDAMGHAGYLAAAVILWFGFQLFKDDLVGLIGGNAGGGVH